MPCRSIEGTERCNRWSPPNKSRDFSAPRPWRRKSIRRRRRRRQRRRGAGRAPDVGGTSASAGVDFSPCGCVCARLTLPPRAALPPAAVVVAARWPGIGQLRRRGSTFRLTGVGSAANGRDQPSSSAGRATSAPQPLQFPKAS